jgi:hypothetical protein
MSDSIGRNNEWALLIHSHIPIGKAPADLGPLIKAVISHADAEQDKILAQWERAHDRMAKALADERVKAARLRALAERILTVHEQVVMDTPEDRDLHDRACATFRAALAGPDPVESWRQLNCPVCGSGEVGDCTCPTPDSTNDGAP